MAIYRGAYFQWWVTLLATVIVFPIALVIFFFSGCEVRKRTEKQACKAGDVDQCLYVGKYYEDKQDGLFGFLMSNADTSIAYYTHACKLKSAQGCERMSYVLAHGDSAKDLSTPLTDIADGLIDACGNEVSGTCDLLDNFSSHGDWVWVRAALAFDKMCNAGALPACYHRAALMAKNLGNLHYDFDEQLALYKKACAKNVSNSCEMVKAYEAQRAGSGS